jgi:hypothetical protein
MSLESARRVLTIEAEAIRALGDRLDDAFIRALAMGDVLAVVEAFPMAEHVKHVLEMDGEVVQGSPA